MSPRKRGPGAGRRGTKALPSGYEDLEHASTVPSSPERPGAAPQDEPLALSRIAACSNISASAYVTEEALASALVGLEGRLAA